MTAPTPTPKQTEIVESNIELPPEVHLETSTGRQRLDSWYSATSRRSAYFSTAGSSYQSTADSAAGDATYRADKPRMYGPASQLPCLTAPLPTEWTKIDGRFVMVIIIISYNLFRVYFYVTNIILQLLLHKQL